MKKVVVVAVFLALLLGGPALHSQTKQPGSRVGKVMVEKLKHAKLLLEGIAVGDFDKIINSSEELIQLSKTAEWHVIKTPRYEMFSNEFRRAADVMIQKAKIKNLDGVTLSYFELTMSCVRCHAYVREVREAGLSGVRPDVALGQTPPR